MPVAMPKPSFHDGTILSFESRRAGETAALIEKYGGRAITAPSMQEVPLSEHSAVYSFAKTLLSGGIDGLICLTGVGTRMMIETMATRHSLDTLRAALEAVVIVSRGPKPKAALREFGLKPNVQVPEPNTWKEVLEAMDGCADLRPLKGKRVAIQEYGMANDELVAGLRERGMRVDQVPIYRWELPDDLAPLKEGIRMLISSNVDVVIFTSRTQIDHVMQVAAEMEVTDALRAALHRATIASIGPVCTEGLREHGFEPDFEPRRPKLGVMMRELAASVA